VIRTPVKAPRANAYAERWVRTVRTECLDWLLILNRRHLEAVLRVYGHHYNAERPHRAQVVPAERPCEPIASAVPGNVCRRDLLGGLLHEYYQAVA
jgi:putative transposase